MKQKIVSLKGTRDFYPADVRARRAMLDPLFRTAESFGYEAYDAPVLEPFALYAAKSSPEIIERQSYVFEDRGGERIVVRPEMTPSLARMIANKQRELPSLLRWYCIADCWRYERPQKGRLRNFSQFNVDLIGSDSVEADVEVIDLALSMIRNLGVDLSRIEVRINDRRLLEGWLTEAGIRSDDKIAALSLLDEKEKLEPDIFRNRLIEISSEQGADTLIKKLELSSAALRTDVNVERLCQTEALLGDLGWQKNIRIDPTVIRGFTYYTGIVFEVYETSGQFRRAIFGGGRYDQLVEALGGSPVSGVGFGVSDVSLEELLIAQSLNGDIRALNVVALIPFSPLEVSFQAELAAALRKEGIKVRTSLPPYGFSPQLKLAQKSGISLVVLIMPDEWRSGAVLLRDLQSGEQERISLANVGRICRERLGL
jgi:histidyl-tRNA synthetase